MNNISDYILVISHDVIGRHMAGPGIRYYHLTRVLSREFKVVLAMPDEQPSDFKNESFETAQYKRRDWKSIEKLVNKAGVVILPSDIANEFPQLATIDAPLVIDGYDPLLAEWYFLNKSLSVEEQYAHWKNRMRGLNMQYLMGDFFLCASERQRDWWLGLLEGNGRVNPYTLSQDPSLRKLIDVVAFGLPSTPPQKTRPMIKSVWPGINESDKVLLWGGGLWPWLDPLTAIEALIEVWRMRQDVRLIFPGTRHPNPMLKNIQSHNEAAKKMALESGLMEKAIFFGDWIPYEDWGNILLESDIALSLHFDTLETRLAFRSRMLEYIWGGLPVIATKGDATSDIVAKYGLGIVVDYGNVGQVVEAILRLFKTPREDFKTAFDMTQKEFTWEHAAQPLLNFCRNPRKAPDRDALGKMLGNPYYIQEIDNRPFIRLRKWFYRMRHGAGMF